MPTACEQIKLPFSVTLDSKAEQLTRLTFFKEYLRTTSYYLPPTYNYKVHTYLAMIEFTIKFSMYVQHIGL